MSRAATAISGWARVIRRVLDDSGCDSAELFHQAGLDMAALDDPNARYPLPATTRLWRLAVEATGDEAFGLRVASAVTPQTFQVLQLSLGASSSLRETFERIVRYYRIVTDAMELSFDCQDDTCRLSILPRVGENRPADEAIDAFVSLFVRTCRSLVGRAFEPRHVYLRRHAPKDPEVFRRVLRAPISFAAPGDVLEMDRATFERRLEGANPELAFDSDLIVQKYLARFDADNIVARVENAVIQHLPQGEPSQLRIAQSLHLSTRSLQRRLAELGKTYSDILDDTRRELACRYLRDSTHSIVEIAYLLGFSDSSNFSRACRRWTGMAPSDIRAGGFKD